MNKYYDTGAAQVSDYTKGEAWYRHAFAVHGCRTPRRIIVEPEDAPAFECFGFYDAERGMLDLYPTDYGMLQKHGRMRIGVHMAVSRKEA